MTRRYFLAATVLAMGLIGIAPDCRAQTTGAVDGKLLSIACNGQIEKNGTTSWRPLRAPRDVWLPLMQGDQVKCIGAGYLEILIPEGSKKITEAQGPFKISAVPVDPPFREIADQLRGFGVPGATRGISVGSRILWPTDNSAVVPKHFVIRWMPLSQKIVLSIMSETKDVTIWGPAEADGAEGSLKSDAASGALANYESKPGNHSLILAMTVGNVSDREEIHFSLLTIRQEQELNAQLDFWAKHAEGLALYLGRGYCLLRNKLFDEAATEYDSALALAPDSRYLLEDAINVDLLAGRIAEVKKLQTRVSLQPETAN